jgi:hypothetical protein
MLTRIEPDAKLMADLSAVSRSNTAIAKYTGNDRGDLKLYTSGDGKRTFLRVTETIKDAERKGAATYRHTLYEVHEPLGAKEAPEPTIVDPNVK